MEKGRPCQASICKITLFTIERTVIIRRLGDFAGRDREKLSLGPRKALGL